MPREVALSMRTPDLCFLLHMHQPQYVDPRTGRAELPWVRLHGARAYLDVARLLEEYPHVKLTVNFVPSLMPTYHLSVLASRPATSMRPSSLKSAERALVHANDLSQLP